jgi:probable addiction module antidote protein
MAWLNCGGRVACEFIFLLLEILSFCYSLEETKMHKAKTSKSQEFSLASMPKMKFKKGVKTIKDNSMESLKDKQGVREALSECLFDDDMEGFKEILKAHLEVRNISNFTKETGLPRKTIYKILEPDSNPTLKNIAKLLNKLCT